MTDKTAYTMMKTFDCQWNEPPMPKDAKKELFDSFDNVGNDVYVEWYVESGAEDGPMNTWLIECGCENGETVLIKRWW